ncbi:MAG: hypothetical protein N3G21_13335 [Candidatus Hydrogenedentes bacterium]|nr:hypothetical protein [Candidatus Hydrogenedentota bacterium]
MIEISVTWAFIIFSLLVLILSAILWYFSEVNARRIYSFYKDQYVWKCSYCAFVYLDTESEEISKCPRCNSFNVIYQDVGGTGITRVEEIEDFENTSAEIRKKNPSRKKNPHARNRGPRRRR